MIKKFLLLVLLALSSGYAALAQDPFTASPVMSTTTLQTSQTASVTVTFGNSSSVAIPQSATATYTINVPPSVGVQPTPTVTVPTGATYSSSNLVVTTTPYSATTGTIITVRSTGGAVPENATYNLVFSILAVAPSRVDQNVLSNAVATGIGTNDSGNDNGSTTFTVGGPLPVSLVSFSAKALENHTVGLAWTTSLETNNKGFLIERSKDLKAFEKVGEVTEIGANSNAMKNYSLTDLTPYQGTSYYRLTQIDLDGKMTVFQDKVVSVILRDGAYGVFPNPVISDQQFRLSLDEPEAAQLNFYGSDGRLMPLQKLGVESGSVLLKVTGKLSTGVYILTVGERGQTRKHRLVVE